MLSFRSVATCIAIACCLVGCASTQRYIDRGNRAYSAGKYGDAALEYRNATKKDPQSGEAYYRLGLAELKLSHGTDAYEALTHAASLSPQNMDAKKNLAELCLASYLGTSARPATLYTQARRLTDELLGNNPNSPDGLRLKGAIALIDNKPDDAVAAVQKAVRISPDSKELQVDLADALFKDNQPDQGERVARQVIAKYPQYPSAYNVLYSSYVSRRRESDAVAILNEWKANNPNDATPVLRLAAYDYRQQKSAEAENLLNSLLQKRGSIQQVDLIVGDFHNAVGDREKALSDYRRGQSMDRDHEAVYLQREASTLAALGRREEAVKALDAILAKDAQNQLARVQKVELLTRLGGAQNLETAAKLAGDLAKEAPGNARVQMVAGQAFAAKRDLASATTCFQQAAKINPRLIPARLALAQIAALRRNYAAVLDNANAVLAVDPNNSDAKLFRVIGLAQSRSYDQAKTEAEQLGRTGQKNAQVELQLGVIALAQKKYPEAERHFQKIYREDDPNNGALAGLLDSYIGEHQPDRALQLAETELKRAPQSGGRAALLVASAQAAGKPGVALAELEKLAADNPKSAEAQIQLGDFQRSQGNFQEALTAYEHARQLAPDRAQLDTLVANMQEELGERPEAIATYRKALSRLPDDPLILNNLAFLLTETHGDLNEALRLATAASRKAPSDPDVQDTLAWIHILKGESEAMLPAVAELTRKYPQNPTYRYHYAVALFQKGDRISAKQQLEAALSNRPAKSTENDIRSMLGQLQ